MFVRVWMGNVGCGWGNIVRDEIVTPRHLFMYYDIQFNQDYMPFCEKHCPIALKDAETLGLLNSDEALTSFIMEKYQHDEL